jgi:hypothetical protein
MLVASVGVTQATAQLHSSFDRLNNKIVHTKPMRSVQRNDVGSEFLEGSVTFLNKHLGDW